MNKYDYLMASILMLVTNTLGGAQEAAATVSGIPVKGYRLIWSDEFNGTALDMTKWDYRSLGPRRDAVNVKETVSLDGKGHLVLTTQRDGNKVHTAMIGTQDTFQTTFGYFECRAKLQDQIGHWSAFWLQTPTMGKEIGNPEASGTEIDIFEYLTKFGDGVVHNLHWDGYQEHHETAGTHASIPGLSQGWHTFGLLWTDQEYVFYVDGQETWRTNKAVSKRSEYIIFSLEVGKWAGDIAKAELPDCFTVDYVRVYQRDTAEQSSATDRPLSAIKSSSTASVSPPSAGSTSVKIPPEEYMIGADISWVQRQATIRYCRFKADWIAYTGQP